MSSSSSVGTIDYNVGSPQTSSSTLMPAGRVVQSFPTRTRDAMVAKYAAIQALQAKVTEITSALPELKAAAQTGGATFNFSRLKPYEEAKAALKTTQADLNKAEASTQTSLITAVRNQDPEFEKLFDVTRSTASFKNQLAALIKEVHRVRNISDTKTLVSYSTDSKGNLHTHYTTVSNRAEKNAAKAAVRTMVAGLTSQLVTANKYEYGVSVLESLNTDDLKGFEGRLQAPYAKVSADFTTFDRGVRQQLSRVRVQLEKLTPAAQAAKVKAGLAG